MAYVYAACAVCVTTGVEFQNPCLPMIYRYNVHSYSLWPRNNGFSCSHSFKSMDFLVHTMDFLVHTASNRLRVFWCYCPLFRSTYCMWVKAAPIISMEKVYTMMSVCTELHVLTAAAHSCALLITPTQLHKFLVSGKEEDGVGIFGVREGGGWGEGCPVLPSNVRE